MADTNAQASSAYAACECAVPGRRAERYVAAAPLLQHMCCLTRECAAAESAGVLLCWPRCPEEVTPYAWRAEQHLQRQRSHRLNQEMAWGDGAARKLLRKSLRCCGESVSCSVRGRLVRAANECSRVRCVRAVRAFVLWCCWCCCVKMMLWCG